MQGAISKVIDPVILNFLPASLAGGVSGSQRIYSDPEMNSG